MNIERGYFVVDPKGRLGLTNEICGPRKNMVTVQYGNSGPLKAWHQDSLRYALKSEVKAAGLWGVGGQIK